MDKVRLGRILGAGTRQAARTAVEAMDAAMAPDPKRQAAPVAASAPQTPHPPTETRAPIQTVLQTVRAVDQGKKAARKAALAPVKRASRILWLEVTGSFFLLFAMGFALNTWKNRVALHPGTLNHRYFVTFAVLTVVFSYFGISSFVRARKVQ